ncbi:hypothetical protein M0P48_01940 [Candidatus Gracilibacteria bacterium]|jgi:hypothetical protein|nr:hypothetical protein [Candidatus Gracilibacteria bacterium]
MPTTPENQNLLADDLKDEETLRTTRVVLNDLSVFMESRPSILRNQILYNFEEFIVRSRKFEQNFNPDAVTAFLENLKKYWEIADKPAEGEREMDMGMVAPENFHLSPEHQAKLLELDRMKNEDIMPVIKATQKAIAERLARLMEAVD